ncbi:MAG TPA: FG-GAP-like repeat-containing protein [Steroidobacteraceae bacterium]|nr:FG-GAP-like repeat-containing protein [Steroidobacteraceae bacterium]
MVMFANSAGGYSAPINTTQPNTNYASAIPIDYNADGLEDILVPYTGNTWWVMLGTSTGLAAHANTGAAVTTTGKGANARAIDIDGDGYQDLVWADLVGYAGGDAIRYRTRLPGGGFSAAINLVGPMPADQMFTSVFGHINQSRTHRIPDFDGDGRGDIVYQMVVRIWNEITWQYNYSARVLCSSGCNLITTTGTVASSVFFGDFNGDRMDDLLYYTSAGTTYKARFSRGTSFGSEILALTAYAVDVHDWEGDGYDDILAFPPGGFLHLIRSTGEGFVNLGSTGIPLSGGAIADVNGDGLADIAYAASGTWRLRPHAGTYPDLLQTATDAFGIATTFAYLPLTDGSVYTKASGSSFPTQEYQGGMWVARTQTSSNGIGGTYTLTHSYESARLHLQGRGSLGFGKHTVIDSRNSIRTEETYLQNPAEYQAIGALDLLRLKQGSGTLIAESDNTWSKLTYSSGTSERRFPYVSQHTVKRWEAEGAYNGAALSTTTTINTVDSTSGTIYDSTTTTVEETTANGVQPGASYVARTYHPLADMRNDTSSTWCIGRPQRTELTNSHNRTVGGAPITRTTTRTWIPTECRITQEIIEPDSTQWKVTRDLLYDGWGNISSDTITGIGMSARTTTTTWAVNNGRFPQSTTNALSQTTQFGWDATIGTLTSVTDPNGLITSWQYDVYGRRTRENRPDGTATTYDLNQCTSGCDSRVRLYVQERPRDISNNVVRTDIQYFDQLDRPLYEYRQMLSGSYSITTRAYDSLGRVINEYFPFWSGTSTPPYATLTYDVLGRIKQISRPTSDSDATAVVTNIYLEGLTTRAVDALGKQSTKIANVAGALARSVDHYGYYQTFDVDAFGNVVQVSDSLSNTLQTITYNTVGMKTAQTDMDMGGWIFTPNALGEVVGQTDAKSQNTSFGFDALGRIISRTEAEGTSYFTFGTSATLKNIGRLESMSGPGYSESYLYDSAGRLQQTTINSDSTYYVNHAYSATGQLDTLTYPTSTSGYRLKLKYEYQYGHLKRVSDFNVPANGFWVANATDPRGAVIDENLGNGLQTIRTFDLVTGLVDSITTGPGGSSTIQNLSYAWDNVGNLTQRQDLRQSLTEGFAYDDLHRLTSTTGVDPITIAYDLMGNIQTKTGILGTYSYHGIKKHAVTTAGSFSFAYDANGNVSTRNGSTITWYSYNLPNTISASGSNSSQFLYAPDRSRWKQVASYAGTAETTIYIGGLIEKVTLGAVTSWRHYIAGASGAVAVYTRKSGAADEMHYLTRDHLGSVDSVTNGSGAVEVRMSFGSFGQRRNEAGWAGNPTSGDWMEITDTTRRGFTSHQMLDNLNLIHMNGRVYDQIVGRFISADPNIPDLGRTQSFNRLSYTSNRPLSFTDPTGFDDAGMTLSLPIDPNYSASGGSVIEGVTVTSSRLDYTADLNFNTFAFAERTPLLDGRSPEAIGGVIGASSSEANQQESGEDRDEPCEQKEEDDDYAKRFMACMSRCMNDRLGGVKHFAESLLGVAGLAAVLGQELPLAGGAVTTNVATYTGGLFGGALGGQVGRQIGIRFGAGTVVGLAVAGSFASGWAIGSSIYCSASCSNGGY